MFEGTNALKSEEKMGKEEEETESSNRQEMEYESARVRRGTIIEEFNAHDAMEGLI